MIPYGKQNIDQDDIDAVVEVLRSEYITTGPKVNEFEERLAEYCGAKYAVAVTSGTAALHLANIAIGTGVTTNVITTPITFLATSNAIIYCGAQPIFADISNKTFTIDPNQVQTILNDSKPIKGIIPVHLGGVVCDMDSIADIAKENDLWIIEDACHALGGSWIDNKGDKHRIGDCSHSDMSVFSFHPVKQITTGEGGAITTNNKDLFEKLICLRSHGMTKNPEKLIENHGDWYYELHEMGFNYRLTDFQAALGIEQLNKNDEWIKKRRKLVFQYDEAFKDFEKITPQLHPDIDGGYSYHLYITKCEDRADLYKYLKNNGVNTQVHYIPIHLQPYYKEKYGYSQGDFPIAEKYYKKALSLPLYPTLKYTDQEKVVSLVKKFYA